MTRLKEAVPPAHLATFDDLRLLERRALPSGRLLLVFRGSDPATEELELRAPNGDVEVRITCGPSGPQVVVHATRLEVNAPSLAIRCGEFDLQAEKTVVLRTKGELRLKAEGDVHVNGAVVRLNCTDDRTPAGG